MGNVEAYYEGVPFVSVPYDPEHEGEAVNALAKYIIDWARTHDQPKDYTLAMICLQYNDGGHLDILFTSQVAQVVFTEQYVDPF